MKNKKTKKTLKTHLKNHQWKVVAITVVAVVSTIVGQQVFARNTDAGAARYVVVLADGVGEDVDVLAKRHGVVPEQRFGYALKGFSAKIPEKVRVKMLEDKNIAMITEDVPVEILAMPDRIEPAGKPTGGGTAPSQVTPAGVSRIGTSQSGNIGAEVHVAVIDTGIDLKHADLKANLASQHVSCVAGSRGANDDNGHGTHVAGTIAAAQNTQGVVGVAPGVKLHAVKVLDRNGSGYISGVICGIDWVAANAASLGIKVANLSLGAGISGDNACGTTNNDALHAAICNATAKGVTFVVAAGNSGADASATAPASYNDTVITVSALADSDGVAGGLGASTGYGADDTFASFSNYGSVVDIAAPGVSILSTIKGGSYGTMSGTSMASPHVAGAAALYLRNNPSASWIEVLGALISAGEALGNGHSDPSGRHPEPVLKVVSF